MKPSLICLSASLLACFLLPAWNLPSALQMHQLQLILTPLSWFPLPGMICLKDLTCYPCLILYLLAQMSSHERIVCAPPSLPRSAAPLILLSPLTAQHSRPCHFLYSHFHYHLVHLLIYFDFIFCQLKCASYKDMSLICALLQGLQLDLLHRRQ